MGCRERVVTGPYSPSYLAHFSLLLRESEVYHWTDRLAPAPPLAVREQDCGGLVGEPADYDELLRAGAVSPAC